MIAFINTLKTNSSFKLTTKMNLATAGKGLAQGPYVTARAGVEPTTFRLKVIVSTNAPPCDVFPENHSPKYSKLH